MHSSRSTAFGKNQTLQLLFLTLWVLEICGFMTNSYHRHRLSCPISQIQITAKHYGKKLWMNTDENSTKGFGSTSIPKPNIITPAKGSQHTQLDKFLMMYTCKICSGRNAQMVSYKYRN